jgi:hypothetical protein
MQRERLGEVLPQIKIITSGYLWILPLKIKGSVGGACKIKEESRGIEKGDGGQPCKGEKEKQR